MGWDAEIIRVLAIKPEGYEYEFIDDLTGTSNFMCSEEACKYYDESKIFGQNIGNILVMMKKALVDIPPRCRKEAIGKDEIKENPDIHWGVKNGEMLEGDALISVLYVRILRYRNRLLELVPVVDNKLCLGKTYVVRKYEPSIIVDGKKIMPIESQILNR